MNKILLNETPLYIGTSGYNHEDWKGTFVPKETQNYDLLTHYAEAGFNFIEITFTFYRVPEADKIRHILTRGAGRLKYSVRLPKSLLNKFNETDYNDFIKGLKPMIDDGLLACVYADYHPLFSASKKNQEAILELRKRFEQFTFFAELSNRTWYKDRIVEYFKENDIGQTIVDMPRITGFAPYYPVCTNHALYFKMYGKSKMWMTAEERFLDYDYSTKELTKFLYDANEKSVMAKNIFMAFGNVTNGLAPKNALEMIKLAKG